MAILAIIAGGTTKSWTAKKPVKKKIMINKLAVFWSMKNAKINENMLPKIAIIQILPIGYLLRRYFHKKIDNAVNIRYVAKYKPIRFSLFNMVLA